ncbi:MAG: AsmA family protein [Planctomycetes bacterium]|nr:AsmA family protein [Planctomycetota bacterium]
MKKIIKSIAALLVLLVVLVFAVFVYIDTIAKTAIQSGAQYALGVDVTLGSADVGLLSGEFAMQDLKIANPDGFESPHFLHLENGNAQITLSSLSENTVVLPTLTLTGIDMHLEKKGDKSNYDVIFENLSRFNSEDKPQDEAEGKKFIIREVLLKDIVVHVEVELLLSGETKLDLPIDEIRLENVGSDSDGGVLLSELTSVLMKQLMLEIVKRGGGLIPADMLDELGQGLSQLDSIAEVGIDVVEGVGDVLKDVGKGIEDLFGGDK